MPLKIAIVGRPNVGKSTLFNRLAGKQLALVDDQPGVTRDRKEAEGRLADLPLILIDTAGFEDVSDGSLEARMRHQTEIAIREAELALFLIDARVGVTAVDERFAQLFARDAQADECFHMESNAAVTARCNRDAQRHDLFGLL